MPKVTITRRSALVGAVAAPLAVAASAQFAPALAKGEMKGVDTRPFSRFKLGDIEVTTLLDGSRTVPEPQNIFAMNVGAEEFAKVSAENFLTTEAARFFFTPTLVNTGGTLVLFDTGLGGDNGSLPEALESAGYSTDQIDIVVITHMHPDHIGGMMTGGKPTYPNASYVTGSVEYDFWTGKGADSGPGKMVAAMVKPLAEKFTFIEGGATVAPGITAVEGFGHTPGHMTYMLESGGKQLLLMADLANHYVWSLAYPEWEVKFDMDKAAAAASRKKLLGMVAADRIPLIGYHMPFPALGYVEARGSGFCYVPASYQLQL